MLLASVPSWHKSQMSRVLVKWVSKVHCPVQWRPVSGSLSLVWGCHKVDAKFESCNCGTKREVQLMPAGLALYVCCTYILSLQRLLRPLQKALRFAMVRKEDSSRVGSSFGSVLHGPNNDPHYEYHSFLAQLPFRRLNAKQASCLPRFHTTICPKCLGSTPQPRGETHGDT